MRLALRLVLAGWELEIDLGRVDGEPDEELVVLSGGPMGFARPELVDENEDEEA